LTILFLLWAASRVRRRVDRIAREGVAAEGQVTALEQMGNILRLRYEYRDTTGELRVGRTGPLDGRLALGSWDRVPIKYDRDHPEWSIGTGDFAAAT
jgi:hypothetical protein